METSVDIQAVQNFVRLAKSAQTRQEYNSKVREFDQRFIQAYPAPTITHPPSIPRSTSNSQRQNTKQNYFEPPKNPFINSQEQRLRQTNLVQRGNPYQHTAYKSQNNNMPPIPHSRSENNFYKPQDSYMREAQANFVNQYAGYGMGYGNPQQQIGMYRNPNVGVDRSFQILPSESKSTNFYNPGPTYNQPPGNQYLANLQEEPDYVKYYKKVIPPQNQSAQKVYTPTQRTNPFKNN